MNAAATMYLAREVEGILELAPYQPISNYIAEVSHIGAAFKQ
jgi:hypothetical protein